MNKKQRMLMLLGVLAFYSVNGKSFFKTGFSANDKPSSSSRAVIKDIDIHQGGMGERISFRFVGDPLCHYIPNREVDVEQALASGTEVTLQFLLPSIEVKGEKNKKLISQINATTSETHSLRIELITKPIPGYVLTVRFHPKKRGFQLESSVSLKGEPTLWLTFYQLDTLQKINYSADSIRKTAYTSLPTGSEQVKKKSV